MAAVVLREGAAARRLREAILLRMDVPAEAWFKPMTPLTWLAYFVEAPDEAWRVVASKALCRAAHLHGIACRGRADHSHPDIAVRGRWLRRGPLA